MGSSRRTNFSEKTRKIAYGDTAEGAEASEEKENEADAGWRRTVTLPTAGFVTSYFPGDTPCPDNTHTTKDNPVLIDVRL